MDKTLTVQRIEAFQDKLHALLLQQVELNQGKAIKEVVFDTQAFKALFQEHGFDERWQWLEVDFEETDATTFLGQLHHADVDQLGTWHALLASGIDLDNLGKFNRDDYVSAQPPEGFGPED